MADPIFKKRDPMVAAFSGLASIAQGYLNAEQTLRDRFESDREHNLKESALNEQIRQFDARQNEIVRQFDASFEQGVKEFDQRLAQTEDHFTRGQEWQAEQNDLSRQTQLAITEKQQAGQNYRQRKAIEAQQQENANRLRANKQYLDLLDNLSESSFDIVTRGGQQQPVDPSSKASVEAYLTGLQIAAQKQGNMRLSTDIARFIFDMERGVATPKETLANLNPTLASNNLTPFTISQDETLIAQYEHVAMMSTTGSWEEWNKLSEADQRGHIARLRRDRGNLPALRATQLKALQDQALAEAVTNDPSMAALWMDAGLQAQGSQGVIFGSYRNQPTLIPGSLIGLPQPIQQQINDQYNNMLSLQAGPGQQVTVDPDMWKANKLNEQLYRTYYQQMENAGKAIDAALPPGDWRKGVGKRLSDYFIQQAGSRTDPEWGIPVWTPSIRVEQETTPAPAPVVQPAPAGMPASATPASTPAVNAPAVQGAAPAPVDNTPTVNSIHNSADWNTEQWAVYHKFVSDHGGDAAHDLRRLSPGDYVAKHGESTRQAAINVGLIGN
mgnify:CR=1 FL=1